jgi:predicted Zn-dependent peptidase
MFYSYLRCSSDNAGRVMETVGAIFQDLGRDGIAEDELNKAKNKVLSALVIKNELSMGRLVDLGFNWMYLGQYRPVEEDVQAVKAVTVDDVNALIGALALDSFTQFTLGPA